jgi:hypothetical protein
MSRVVGLESARVAREPGTGPEHVNQMLATLDIAVQVRRYWMSVCGVHIMLWWCLERHAPLVRVMRWLVRLCRCAAS